MVRRVRGGILRGLGLSAAVQRRERVGHGLRPGRARDSDRLRLGVAHAADGMMQRRRDA